MITELKLREAVDWPDPYATQKLNFWMSIIAAFKLVFRSKSEEDGFELVTIRTQPLPVYLEIHPTPPPPLPLVSR